MGLVGAAEVDFGFNFDTIVNTNDSGQGSLRQFIRNSNALANAGLDQLGYPAGVETSIFMIPSDADPLSRPQDPGFDGLRGVAVITLASVLPAIQDAATSIDATSQTDNIGDTNAGEFDHPEPEFSGNKNVGTAGALLPSYFNPEVEIDGNDQGTIFEVAAGSGSVKGVALFNAAVGAYAVRFTAGTGGLLTESFVGPRAEGTDPGAGLRVDSGVETSGGEADIIGNLLAYTEDNGIVLKEAGEASGNEIYRVALTDANGDGISTEGSTGQAIVIRENRIDRPSAFGIETWQAPGPFVIEDNTVSRAGLGSIAETGGIRVFGSGSTVRHNVVTGSAGAGIVLVQRGTPGSNQQNLVSENSVYANGGPSIDIDITNTGALDNPDGDGVTGNDGATDAMLPDIDMDYPVFTRVIPSGGSLHVEGYVGTLASRISGAHTIEVFKAEDDSNNDGEIERLDGQSVPHGEGRWFIDSCTTAMDGTFVCDLTIPGTVTFGLGDAVTASAIDPANNTSELGPNAAASALSIVKRAFQVDGTPIASGSTLPRGMPVKFLLYVSNPGGLLADVSLRDVLDPLFLYSAESIRYDNSVASCATAACSPAEEAAIFAAADAGTVGSDAVDGDPVSLTGVTLNFGNQDVGNAQLDFAAAKVWAVVFTIHMQ